ncbi:MAG TPA: hypothetical protein VHZ28_11475 [Terracidiphilus sp.]|jgi:hypothetical protein|nr:hypothetical protein [Terracidiphilus sp.]
MHFNFDWTAVQVIWTLTFAAHLVLLVVLLGRDRVARFRWFTISISLVALRLLASRLLFNRLPQLALGEIFVVLADISVLVSLLVLLELARRAFGSARRRLSLAWIGAFLIIGGIVVATWGHWPAWKTLTPMTKMVFLNLLQLFAQKGGILVDVLTVLLGILMISIGRHYGARWRTHTQRIMIGLSTASLGQLAVQIIWQIIAKSAKPHSMAEYQHVVDLREKLFNANSVVYLAVTIWWIACLWIDEPGSPDLAEVAVPVAPDDPQLEASAAAEPPEDLQE